MAKHWHAIYTKTKKEGSVAQLLSNAGIDIFSPKLKLKKLYRNQRREVIEPLFPCYIFALFNFPEQYRLVKYTRGIRRVVGTPSGPVAVDEKIISAIEERLVNGVAEIKPPEYKKGDVVEIASGPFKGLGGIFEKEISGKERGLILLDTIMRPRLEIDKEDIIKAC
jgi:transcription elongation factor/antiterminator RfaH